jgi:FkbM family methyltransferase
MYFDIGANIGKWSQANNMAATKIIAVEAVPITFQKLVAASTLYKHILCENYAVCDNSENDILFYNCTDADTISTLNKDWLTDPSSRFNNFSYNEIICKTITLDALILKYGLPVLIKIDVASYERNNGTSSSKHPTGSLACGSQYLLAGGRGQVCKRALAV